MAMATATCGAKRADIKVTPMIDVLLVLWMISMVIVPAILAYTVNETQVMQDDLLPRLTAFYAHRAEGVMFVKADHAINLAYIADVFDIGKAMHVDHIGWMTPRQPTGL